MDMPNLSSGLRQVAFVGHEYFGRRLRAFVFQVLEPIVDVPEALLIADVEHDDDAVDSPEKKRHRR